jgi:competence protein ComEC
LATAAGCRIEVWHPPAAGVVGRDLDKHNANCIVLDIEYAGKRVLLTGDLEGTGLRNLMAELPCHCDVLLAPHHGSMASDPAGLSQWSTPDYVIVSNAPAFQTGKTVSTFQATGATVLNTADFGAINVTIDARGIRLQTFRQTKAIVGR